MLQKNDGKASEEKVRVLLKGYQASNKAFFIRLYDTTSARGSFIPAQPADFVGTFQSVSWAIEVKSSVIHPSLLKIKKDALREDQVALMRLHCRAGGEALYVFHHIPTDAWEIWNAKDVFHWFITPRAARPEEKRRLASCFGGLDLKIKLLQVLKC